MSYGFKIAVKDGTPVIQADNPGVAYGTIPDGYFQISGHSDNDTESITVSRYTDDDLTVSQASSYHVKS